MASAGQHESDTPRRGGTVLIVDDDPDFLAYIRAGLRHFGHRAIGARSGSEARVRLGEHPETVLILMDRLLPDADGVELIEELRHAGNGTAVFFVSSFIPDHETRARLAAQGVTEILNKRRLDALETFKKLHFAVEAALRGGRGR